LIASGAWLRQLPLKFNRLPLLPGKPHQSAVGFIVVGFRLEPFFQAFELRFTSVVESGGQNRLQAGGETRIFGGKINAQVNNRG
jgi:hypothetical protein